jgi:hypothetical protein
MITPKFTISIVKYMICKDRFASYFLFGWWFVGAGIGVAVALFWGGGFVRAGDALRHLKQSRQRLTGQIVAWVAVSKIDHI